jgi:hypothetical protein
LSNSDLDKGGAHQRAVADFSEGGYRFIPGGFQFSGGVAAAAGYEIRRYRFRTPAPLADGFARIEAIIKAAGRPLTAFCACELRSPGQFTEQGFREFNESYVVTLGHWGVYNDKVNPVARSNVCPEIDPSTEPAFHAFSFTVPAATGVAPSFVISGSAEARAIEASYRERIVRYGEHSPDAMREKAGFVLEEISRRLALFGVGWRDSTASQVYTIRDIYPFFADEIVRRGAAHAGVTWHFARPPVRDLEFEVDCRSVRVEEVL